MATVRGPLNSQAASGSVGRLTYRMVNGRAVVTTKAQPTGEATPDQIRQRARMGVALYISSTVKARNLGINGYAPQIREFYAQRALTGEIWANRLTHGLAQFEGQVLERAWAEYNRIAEPAQELWDARSTAAGFEIVSWYEGVYNPGQLGLALQSLLAMDGLTPAVDVNNPRFFTEAPGRPLGS